MEKRTAEDERLDNISDSKDMNLSKFREITEDREDWRAVVQDGCKESDTT